MLSLLITLYALYTIYLWLISSESLYCVLIYRCLQVNDTFIDMYTHGWHNLAYNHVSTLYKDDWTEVE